MTVPSNWTPLTALVYNGAIIVPAAGVPAGNVIQGSIYMDMGSGTWTLLPISSLPVGKRVRLRFDVANPGTIPWTVGHVLQIVNAATGAKVLDGTTNDGTTLDMNPVLSGNPKIPAGKLTGNADEDTHYFTLLTAGTYNVTIFLYGIV